MGDAASPEAIPVSLAVTLGIAYTVAYVLPFYLSAATRPSPALLPSAPAVIRARVRLVAASCAACTPVTVLVLRRGAGLGAAEVARRMGVWPLDPLAAAKVVLLAAVLFAGPLFERGWVEGGWRRWLRGHAARDALASWVGWRNYVAGPLSEEYLFRALLLPIYMLASPSFSAPVLLSPLPFALAHLHHINETRLTHPGHPWLPLAVGGLLQFTYTALFGWFAAFALARSGSLLGVVLAHSLCNWMGLPRVWGWVEPEWAADWPAEAEAEPFEPGPQPAQLADELWDSDGSDAPRRRAAGRRGDKAARVLGIGQPAGPVAGRKGGVDWVGAYTAAYYVLLVGGAVSFSYLLWPLTEGSGAGTV